MSAAPMAQTPVVPPRPARSSDKDVHNGLVPKVPPRPGNKHVDRSVSPRRDRFAQSPLMQGIPCDRADIQSIKYYPQKQQTGDPLERARSVDMPSVGEEGMEYTAVASELSQSERRPSAPEQTRMVAEGLKLHAPKPSLPASSAKQQVMAVTRTDSDKAASFGIGQPSTTDERAVSRGSNRKRPESTYSAHSDHTEDEHGIPEIGQRVPMNRHLGDVQAPSPGPAGQGSESPKKNHGRKLSARGLPPGSYGLHGHGVLAQDKLEKAYYEKHPEALQRERSTPHHDRQNDFAMSSSDLNKLVRDTANRHAATGSSELRGTPTDDVAFEATEKYASRMSSRPTSMIVPNDETVAAASQPQEDDKETVHVDDGENPEFYHYGEAKDDEPESYNAPILASDEVSKDASPVKHKPAIRPHLQRQDSSFEEDPPSRPSSRPSSRPRVQRVPSHQKDIRHTPLEDVEEYDPLFPEDGKDTKAAVQEQAEESCERHHFPSKDVWEDAPSSVHATAEVSTPDVPEPERRRSSAYADRPITPAQAFALYQEQLAEKESSGRSNYLPLQDSKPPTWVGHQAHLKSERSSSNRRFPSRDVWEDAPESHIHEAEVSNSHEPAEPPKPDIPARPAKKASTSPERPEIPERPFKQDVGDDFAKPVAPISDKAKPVIPPRPAKSSPGTTKDAGLSKPKPPVPSRPVGGKIAALQAGFMSDLNKRLQLGPQAVKKDEPQEDEVPEEKEKAPLSDARKGRARGPQRRAPVKSAAVAASIDADKPAPVLSFSLPQTVWSIDPDQGGFTTAPRESSPPVSSTETESTSIDKQSASSEGPTSSTAPASNAEAPNSTAKSESQGVNKAHVTQGNKRELTLAANTAGESILETVVQQDDDNINPVEVHEDVKS